MFGHAGSLSFRNAITNSMLIVDNFCRHTCVSRRIIILMLSVQASSDVIKTLASETHRMRWRCETWLPQSATQRGYKYPKDSRAKQSKF